MIGLVDTSIMCKILMELLSIVQYLYISYTQRVKKRFSLGRFPTYQTLTAVE